MIETGLAIVGILRIFTFAVSTIKGILFVEQTVKKLATSERKEFIVAHVYESHLKPLKYCDENQCGSF